MFLLTCWPRWPLNSHTFVQSTWLSCSARCLALGALFLFAPGGFPVIPGSCVLHRPCVSLPFLRCLAESHLNLVGFHHASPSGFEERGGGGNAAFRALDSNAFHTIYPNRHRVQPSQIWRPLARCIIPLGYTVYLGSSTERTVSDAAQGSNNTVVLSLS